MRQPPMAEGPGQSLVTDSPTRAAMAAPVPTMATEGRRIVYNPTVVEGLKPAELEGVLAHEVLRRHQKECAMNAPRVVISGLFLSPFEGVRPQVHELREAQ